MRAATKHASGNGSEQFELDTDGDGGVGRDSQLIRWVLRHRAEVTAGTGAGHELIRSASEWTQGDPPRRTSAEEARHSTGVRWFDLDCTADHAEAAHRLLQGACPGLTAEMVGDLLTPDEHPAEKRYGDGSIRLATSFRVEAHRADGIAKRGEPERAGFLVFQPVELLAGEDWLVTSWHPKRIFRGGAKVGEGDASPPPEFYDRVARRWANGKGRNAGDLGVLLLHELVLTYGSACRALENWLEDWELGFYLDAGANRDQLVEIWGSMAVTRDWVRAQDRSGLEEDIDRAWLCATDPEEAIRVDSWIDNALDNLRGLAQTMRSSFNVLHVQQLEEQRDRREHLLRRIELVAAAFLIPTLIVGFWGANTWVPGQGEHWGFWVMLAALVLLSGAGVLLVRRWQRKQQEDEKEKAAQSRAQLLREGLSKVR